jgi:phosphoserine aminotransferase
MSSQANKRVHNFSAGPATVDTDVMEKVQKEWLNYKNTGMGFVEMSHRDVKGPVQTCIVETQQLVRELLNVPATHEILFMHGGAHQQFSAVPLNICATMGEKVDFIDTGFWSMRAMGHAEKYCDCKVVSTNRGFLQDPATWQIRPDAKYVHVCHNETIAGLEYLADPDLSEHPTFKGKGPNVQVPWLVCDATSTLMSRPLDISKYGCIFASSGKNLGPAGICLVIVHKELLKASPNKFTPQMMDWREQANSKPIQNIYNTPPTFQIYMMHHVLTKCKEDGGCAAMEIKCKSLAEKCYNHVDASSFYRPVVNVQHKKHRSRMNVCFQIGGAAAEIGKEARAQNMALEKIFTKTAADDHGVHQLMGHPIFGGLRITIYNPMPHDAVDAALTFMDHFAAKHGHQVADGKGRPAKL